LRICGGIVHSVKRCVDAHAAVECRVVVDGAEAGALNRASVKREAT
jgi:hypothetical protein